MASIGCNSDLPSKSTHQDPARNTYIISAGREHPLEQTFGLNREAEQLTKNMEIALEEHKQFHIINETFRTMQELELHLELMRDAILNGASFLQAHEIASK